MKVGILTFHRAHNYGAVLQCYALQHYLELQGHSVSVIDYQPRQFYEFYNWYKPKFLKVRNPIEFIRRLKILNARRLRYAGFQNFIENKLNLCTVGTIFEDPFDLVIVGSDQVWNSKEGIDPFYWGAIKYPEKTVLASYAASMPDTISVNVVPVINSLLKNFKYISARETLLQSNLQNLTERQDIYHVVDPTLLLNQEDWSSMVSKRKIKRPYLLLYMVQHSNEAERIARQIAKDRGLKIIYLTTDVDFKTSKNVRTTSPRDFISLFKFADFIVSASFHGTVFSLQFGKPFLSYKMGIGKDARVENLLSSLGLAENFTQTYNPAYSYDCIFDNRQLYRIKESSYEYIKMITK